MYISIESPDKDFPEDIIVDFLSFYGEVICMDADSNTDGFVYDYKVVKPNVSPSFHSDESF